MLVILGGVLDLYSRRLIDWGMGSSMETALQLATLHMTLRKRLLGATLLNHSDRSCRMPVQPIVPPWPATVASPP